MVELQVFCYLKLVLLVTYWSLEVFNCFCDSSEAFGFVGVPSKIRTCDPLIKSQMLYRLSYGHLKHIGTTFVAVL
jgi:hypothetical protein